MVTAACGPGQPGGTPPGTAISDSGDDTGDEDDTNGDGDSDDTQTSLTTNPSTSATTVSSVSDTNDDGSTSWNCEGGSEIIMERQCFPFPQAGTTTAGTGSYTDTDGVDEGASDTDAGECDWYVDNPPVDNYYGELIESEGPFVEGGQCCYDVTYEVFYPCGRPFFVEESPRVAKVAPRSDWSDRPSPDVDGLGTETRALLADAWLEDALAEHASIASFARFSLQLLALGAPPDLLSETHRAMDDELEHARLCFALASAYAGREIGPGQLAVEGALDDAHDLAAAVVSAIREGCIGETMAAMQAEVALGLAGDPAVVSALRRIAKDESAHAALAWRFVDWAVKQGGASIRAVAAEAFERWAPRAAGNTRGPSPDLQRHGRLGEADLALLQRRTFDEVIRPCANAVLATPAISADHADTLH